MKRTTVIFVASIALLAASLAAQETRKATPASPAPAAISFVDNGQKLGTGDSWYVQLVDTKGDGRLEAYFDGAIWLNDGQGHFTKSEQSFGLANRPAYFADLTKNPATLICQLLGTSAWSLRIVASASAAGRTEPSNL